MASLDPATRDAFARNWDVWGRPEQHLPPGDWFTWLILAGRGWGKTRTGAEAVRKLVGTGKYGLVALIGQTVSDVRDVMVKGESGLLACYPKADRPVYTESKRIVRFQNGAIAYTYSGDEPEQLRGPQHMAAWADEVAKWKYARACWDNMEFGLRLGTNPIVVVTTTPRPIKIIKELIADEMTHITTGTTYDNINNLAEKFKRRVISRYEGTRLGQQELHAKILDDNPHALWKSNQLEALRIDRAPDLWRIVIGVDPQGVKDPNAEVDEEQTETGIVAVGLGPCTGTCVNPALCTGHGYLLDDASLAATPGEWGKAVAACYRRNKADRVVAETNNGGDMVIYVLESADPTIPARKVHASRGKHTRAEPIAALYEQGRFHHVGGFAALEDQMTTWQPGMKSPDRMDAHVWAATDLFFGDEDPQEGLVEHYEPVFISPI